MKQRLSLIFIVTSSLCIAGCISMQENDTDNKSIVSTEATFFGSWTWSDIVDITSPISWTPISSPVTIIWEMSGYWFFEATAPVQIVDSDDIQLWEWYVTTQGERMTGWLVAFSWSVMFSLSWTTATTWSVILRRNNVSGLSENDAYVAIPVVF